MSNVFRQIKSADVHQRPFKAYKQYYVLSNNIGTGHVTQSGIYYDGRIDQDGEIPYITNSDGTNMYVSWHAVKQRFYDNRSTALPEHVLNPLNERFLFVSSSTLTLPYNQVGERIKNGTFQVTSSIGDLDIKLRDDGDGNLIDPLIEKQHFASSSKNMFYMSFNDTYQYYQQYFNTSMGQFSGSISYKVNGSKRLASYHGDMEIVPGVDITGSAHKEPSGLGVNFIESGMSAAGLGSQIRIPHDDVFNRFGKCDDWTISFWARNTLTADGATEISTDVILSKHALTKQLKYQPSRGMQSFQDFTMLNANKTVSGSNIRVPFHVTLASGGNYQKLTMEASDGTNNIKGSVAGNPYPAVDHQAAVSANNWCHWTIRNSGSLLQIFANAESHGGNSGSLPAGPTANAADLTFGSRTKEQRETVNISLAEVRMYDYAVNQEGITSLANRDYGVSDAKRASLYQTNVVGNVFHRNGQAVVSSVLPQYHSGSGIFGDDHTWNARYRGTHTIYENQAFVRVPKDILNVSMNPSATYTPVTDGNDACSPTQNNLLPGEVRKDLFISGTLKPYITTIGLYNDESQLVAVGKLAQPIQKRDDVDMNFVVRWDY